MSNIEKDDNLPIYRSEDKSNDNDKRVFDDSLHLIMVLILVIILLVILILLANRIRSILKNQQKNNRSHLSINTSRRYPGRHSASNRISLRSQSRPDLATISQATLYCTPSSAPVFHLLLSSTHDYQEQNRREPFNQSIVDQLQQQQQLVNWTRLMHINYPLSGPEDSPSRETGQRETAERPLPDQPPPTYFEVVKQTKQSKLEDNKKREPPPPSYKELKF